MFENVVAVMAFADSPDEAAAWYGNLLGVPVHREVSESGAVFAWVEHAGVEIGFHPADDERNPRGGSPVVYWRVADVDKALAWLLEAGCTHHRGPLRVSPQRQIAQVIDPFGVVLGVDDGR
ncbi:VOC family protein [Streptacidiphilus sp. P02-A3a]|uniref:VOC family protein n=1 Tax=Streptacidiphilus sp. P02-A3a TaxID=2704468 RepID=UPI0015FD4899|nr:VOC family protein [Streptacidiphilus sp. P02-A3a]QMU71441.1 glyoxalase [Streptacidiphilus sp. P02-A3a]